MAESPVTSSIHGSAVDAYPSSLRDFRMTGVLNEDNATKTLCISGMFGASTDIAVVTISRRQFDIARLAETVSQLSDFKLDFRNDIYSKYTAVPEAPADKSVTVDIIYPATKKHLNKYRSQDYHMIRETLELYRDVTLPYIESFPPSRIQWVYNILDKTAEADRLLLEDPDPQTGFMLHPDLKWDQAQVQSLYCIVLCHRRDIRSLRDLRAVHLPLLDNIRARVHEAVEERYGVQADQLRIFVHYQPSYYHFHVHVCHVGLTVSAGMAVGKAYLLDDIIDNIRTIDGDYYSKCTMSYTLGSREPLLEAHRKRLVHP